MDILNLSNKNSGATGCVIVCFFFCVLFISPFSHARLNDEITSTISPIETPLAESDRDLAQKDDGEDDVSYLVGCTGGAIAGSIVPGIGTLFGALAGCITAYIW